MHLEFEPDDEPGDEPGDDAVFGVPPGQITAELLEICEKFLRQASPGFRQELWPHCRHRIGTHRIRRSQRGESRATAPTRIGPSDVTSGVGRVNPATNRLLGVPSSLVISVLRAGIPRD